MKLEEKEKRWQLNGLRQRRASPPLLPLTLTAKQESKQSKDFISSIRWVWTRVLHKKITSTWYDLTRSQRMGTTIKKGCLGLDFFIVVGIYHFLITGHWFGVRHLSWLLQFQLAFFFPPIMSSWLALSPSFISQLLAMIVDDFGCWLVATLIMEFRKTYAIISKLFVSVLSLILIAYSVKIIVDVIAAPFVRVCHWFEVPQKQQNMVKHSYLIKTSLRSPCGFLIFVRKRLVNV